jgi:hypothetical protein
MKVKELIEELKKYDLEKEVHLINDYFKHDAYIDVFNRLVFHEEKSYEFLTIKEVIRKPHILKVGDIVNYDGVEGKVVSIDHAATTGEPMCSLESLENEEMSCSILQKNVEEVLDA